ncbi:hypothetical protein MnTg04_00533 [bacterium MnTg04]|nr:hypothetical protein MnTg04_00533 [bacterium MnTg04]
MSLVAKNSLHDIRGRMAVGIQTLGNGQTGHIMRRRLMDPFSNFPMWTGGDGKQNQIASWLKHFLERDIFRPGIQVFFPDRYAVSWHQRRLERAADFTVTQHDDFTLAHSFFLYRRSGRSIVIVEGAEQEVRQIAAGIDIYQARLDLLAGLSDATSDSNSSPSGRGLAMPNPCT